MKKRISLALSISISVLNHGNAHANEQLLPSRTEHPCILENCQKPPLPSSCVREKCPLPPLSDILLKRERQERGLNIRAACKRNFSALQELNAHLHAATQSLSKDPSHLAINAHSRYKIHEKVLEEQLSQFEKEFIGQDVKAALNSQWKFSWVNMRYSEKIQDDYEKECKAFTEKIKKYYIWATENSQVTGSQAAQFKSLYDNAGHKMSLR